MNSQWLFYKIRLGQYAEAADPTIRELFAQLQAQPQVRQWFYIRYGDQQDGFHLRLRLLVNAEDEVVVRQHTEQQLDQWLMLVPQLAAAHTPRQPLTQRVPAFSYQPLPVQWLRAEYEPELEKFGEGEGLEIAHRWFQKSSDLAVQLLQLEQQAPGVRNALVYLLSQQVCDVFQPSPSPARFLQQYSYTWLPRNLVQVNNYRKQFFRDALALLEQQQPLLPQLQDWPAAATTLVQQWRQCLQHTRQQLNQQGYSTTFIQHQGWQCIHLMNNRLGISPFEESYLATLLEAWYREEARHVA